MSRRAYAFGELKWKTTLRFVLCVMLQSYVNGDLHIHAFIYYHIYLFICVANRTDTLPNIQNVNNHNSTKYTYIHLNLRAQWGASFGTHTRVQSHHVRYIGSPHALTRRAHQCTIKIRGGGAYVYPRFLCKLYSSAEYTLIELNRIFGWTYIMHEVYVTSLIERSHISIWGWTCIFLHQLFWDICTER